MLDQKKNAVNYGETVPLLPALETPVLFMINGVIFVPSICICDHFKRINNKILLKVLAKEENKIEIYIFLKLDSKPTICRK